MILKGHFVLAHLVSPNEKFWGRLEEMSAMGFVLRGLNVESFEDWLRDVSRDERQGVGLVTMFVPLHRLERLFLDERVGGVESYREVFERRTGRPIESAFGGPPEGDQPSN